MSFEDKASRFSFQSPANIIVSGASQSGKTFFTIELIKNASDLFINPPVKIIYCYNIFQKSFEKIAKYVQFHHGIPDINDVADKKGDHVLIIIDDLMQEIDSQMTNLFTVQTHHLNLSCIFILQNLFYQNKHLRTMSLNSHYFILFRQSRDMSQINIIARQIFGKKSNDFLKVYEQIMVKPYSYLLINIHPSNIYRVSVHLDFFPGQYEITYL